MDIHGTSAQPIRYITSLLISKNIVLWALQSSNIYSLPHRQWQISSQITFPVKHPRGETFYDFCSGPILYYLSAKKARLIIVERMLDIFLLGRKSRYEIVSYFFLGQFLCNWLKNRMNEPYGWEVFPYLRTNEGIDIFLRILALNLYLLIYAINKKGVFVSLNSRSARDLKKKTFCCVV